MRCYRLGASFREHTVVARLAITLLDAKTTIERVAIRARLECRVLIYRCSQLYCPSFPGL